MKVGKKYIPKEISIISVVPERLISCFWILSKRAVTVPTRDGSFPHHYGVKTHNNLQLLTLGSAEAD